MEQYIEKLSTKIAFADIKNGKTSHARIISSIKSLWIELHCYMRKPPVAMS